MSVRRTRFVLRLSASFMLAASAALVAWAVTAPIKLPDSPATTGPAPTRNRITVDESTRLNPGQFEAVFERQFRRPLFDPPPEEPAPVVETPPTPPPVRLVATMPEPGGGHAMLADAKGSISVRGIGQEMRAGDSSVVIKEVSSDAVVLLYEDRLVTLTLGKK